MQDDRRVLLYGPPGTGKSTLAKRIAAALAQKGRECRCLNADPGSPAFAVPGAVSLGLWYQHAWQILAMEPLCSLDAGRFRLPLISLVRRLTARESTGVLLLDSPGVVRGVAGRELLTNLVEAARVDIVLALCVEGRPWSLLDELKALPVAVYLVTAPAGAKRPGKRVRARERTRLWDAYLQSGFERCLDISALLWLGTPPPLDAVEAWAGRQVAFFKDRHLLAMAEILAVQGTTLLVRTTAEIDAADRALVRDVRRNAGGMLETAEPFASEQLSYLPSSDPASGVMELGGLRIMGRAGAVDFDLVNGEFGDPLLHLRLRHQGRSLLFDLGEGRRLPARLAHQVTDVFISHAHLDHISGFSWLLRSRINHPSPCRLYGPPGLAIHIQGFIQGVLWDRVRDRGPRFEIAELHGNRLQRYRLQAGTDTCERMEDTAANQGIILRETTFQVRAVFLDHHTPVLAFALEPVHELKVRRDRLHARGLEPGPWLKELKACLAAGERGVLIELPDGSKELASALGSDLILFATGKKLVYATDLADTPDNRCRLISLARGAHTLFCEAMFLEAQRDHAARHGHLTTTACGEIATQAGVARLVPFHFSRRYENDPMALYEEIAIVCSRVVKPKAAS
nr:Clp1/GlmU family protein [Desulfobulbus alkaliphilus]